MSGSDAVFASDCRQSVSAETVAGIVKSNQERAERNAAVGIMEQEMPIKVPEAGVTCPKDQKHGRMLMSLKDGMLECGICSFKVQAPK